MSGSGAKRALTAAEAYSLLLHVRYPLEIYETSSPGDLFRGLFLERGGIMVSVGTKGDIRMPIAAAKIFGCSVFVFESDAVVRDAGLRIARTERVDHLIAFYPLDTSNIDFLKKSLTKPGISSSLVTHFCGVAMETLNQFEGTVTKLLQLGCRVVTENVHFDTFTNYDVSAGYRFLRKKQHTVETVLSGQEYSSSMGKLLGRQRDASARAAAKEAVDKPCLTGRAVGLVFDDRMTLHAPPVDEKSEIETPLRLFAIGTTFEYAGIVEKMIRVEARPAREEELLLAHTKKHIEEIASLVNPDVRKELRAGFKRRSLYFNQHTLTSSLIAVGGTIELVEKIASGQCRNGIAIVRPPGHHAEENCAMGFCMYNNVAVAARVVQKKFPDNVKKILIVDWDVHHGNGTQKIFYDDPTVLYFSVHLYLEGLFYPSGEAGSCDKTGIGPGRGYNVNVAWDKIGMGDSEYLHAWDALLMPIARVFDPDLVLVSAGFDAARGDPIGMCDISPEGYSHLLSPLLTLAEGRVAIVLEGGYNLTSISKSALACVETLLGEPLPRLRDMRRPHPSAVEAVQATINALKGGTHRSPEAATVTSSGEPTDTDDAAIKHCRRLSSITTKDAHDEEDEHYHSNGSFQEMMMSDSIAIAEEIKV